MNVELTSNFRLNEFTHSQTAERNSDIAQYQFSPSNEVVNSLRYLCENSIQPLRTLLKTPMRISSGYRCPALNTAVGGSPRSQHMKGEAADVVMSDHLILDEALSREKEVIENMAYERVGKWFRNDINASFYLFAAACLYLNELDIDQLIHEYGSKGSPSWVHISSSRDRNNRQILILPDNEVLTIEEALLLAC